MWLVVGLGNPGREYAGNRHNVGFMVADELRRAASFPDPKEKWSGRFSKGEIDGESVVVLEPLTFMNLSGECVQPAAAFFDVEPERIVVVHDELDLAWKDVRLKFAGGHAGHNG